MPEDFPCIHQEGTEQLAQAMAGRILAGMGTVDFGRELTHEDVDHAADLADRFAGDDGYEPFASTADYLRTVGLGAAACARNWANQRCPTNCFGRRYYESTRQQRRS